MYMFFSHRYFQLCVKQQTGLSNSKTTNSISWEKEVGNHYLPIFIKEQGICEELYGNMY